METVIPRRKYSADYDEESDNSNMEANYDSLESEEEFARMEADKEDRY